MMPGTGSFRMRLACINLFSGLIAWSSVCSAVPQAEYDAAILDARAGKTASALERLQGWHAANPADLRIIYDLAAVLDMAGQYAAALTYREKILTPDAHPYAIKAIGHAARASGEWATAEAAYRLLVKKTPADAEAHAGLAYAWMGQDRIQEALDYVAGYLPKSPAQYRQADVPMIIALAELHERRTEWLQAAAAYQEALRLNPGFRYAVRGRVLALANAGVSFLAKRLADEHPEAFNAEEKFRFAHDVNAQAIRFGEAQLGADDNARRFRTTDIALSGNADLLGRHGAEHVVSFDRLVALRDRVRMEDAVKLYESLRAQKIVVPVYARLAAADAYLWLKQPEIARDLYVDALNEVNAVGSGDMLSSQIALIYAYVESEQHREAKALADRLVSNTPRQLHKGIRGLETANPEYGRVYLVRSLLDLYGDRLEEAEKRLSDLRTRAPLSHEIRAAWASLQSAREHPRASLEEFTKLKTDEPKSVDAAIGRIEMLLSLHQLVQARTELQPLLTEYPENRTIRELQTKIKNYESPLLRVDVTTGRGAAALGADSVYDAALYSAPLKSTLGERYRVFSHLTRSNGSDAAGDESRTRLGVGLDYRNRDFLAEAEVNHTVDGTAKSGVVLALTWNLSDNWQARAVVDTNVVDLPVAAMRNGLDGKSLKLGLTWSLNESRQAGGELSSLRFSDDNVRNIAQVWWRERLISQPGLKLDALLSLSTSTNSALGRAYFNPERDQELSLGLRSEWLLWRRYQRWFKHALGVKWGQYWQSGFAGGSVGDVHYEQEWSRDDILNMKYGIGRSFHPYDGVRDYRSYLYMNLIWRIQ